MWICGLYLSADGSLMTDHLQLLGHPMVCFVGAQLCLTCWLVTHEVHGRPPLRKRQPPRGSLLKLVLWIVLCYAMVWAGLGALDTGRDFRMHCCWLFCLVAPDNTAGRLAVVQGCKLLCCGFPATPQHADPPVHSCFIGSHGLRLCARLRDCREEELPS